MCQNPGNIPFSLHVGGNPQHQFSPRLARRRWFVLARFNEAQAARISCFVPELSLG